MDTHPAVVAATTHSLTPHQIFVDDVVCLKTDKSRVGLVERLGWNQDEDDDEDEEEKVKTPIHTLTVCLAGKGPDLCLLGRGRREYTL